MNEQKTLELFDSLIIEGKKPIHWEYVNSVKSLLDDAGFEYIEAVWINHDYTMIEITEYPE